MPRCAVSKSPFLVWCASVKAPLMCPNSSLSRSASGRAAQLTDTKVASRRGDRACRALATSSLPVPLSPCSSTVELVAATERISSNTFTMGGATPMMLFEPVLDAELRLEAEVLVLELLFLQGVAHDDLQLLHVEGLDQVVLRTQLQGGHGRLRRTVGGHDDDDGLRRRRPQVAQDLDAVPVGQLDVGDDEVDGTAGEDGGGGGAAVRHLHREALLAQHDAEQLAHGRLVVDDQDLLHVRYDA